MLKSVKHWRRTLRRRFTVLFAALCALLLIGNLSWTIGRKALAATYGSSMPVEAADRFADGIASVNAPLCKSAHAFGPGQDAASRAEIAYLEGYHFRHVRDSFLACYNQNEFDDAWRVLAAAGARLLSTEFFSYTDADITRARTINPGVEAFSAGNEWDVENVDEVLGKDATAGDRVIVTRPFGLANHLVAGQSYRFVDAQSEVFELLAPLSHDSGSVRDPIRYPHRAGTRIVRVGDFVSDINFWLAFYSTRLRAAHPPFPLIGASLAFPIHAESFSEPTDRTDGHFGLDAVEEHGYPAPMGSNPEGADGDSKRGYITVDHPPCSFSHTSYSMSFNSCEAERQTGRASIPIWETEFSYQVVPNGSAPLPSTQHPIPDRTSILYLTRSELFAAAHGRTRLYWFQMLDGTSGPRSGFCTYGLIYTGRCGEELPVSKPVPKGELLALGNMIEFFKDASCTFPACNWAPPNIFLQWSDASLPLNTSVFAWKSGKIAIVAWLGMKSYDFAGSECSAHSGCSIGTNVRAESLSSPSFEGRSISITSFDTDPRDPFPPNTITKLPDNSTQSIAECPQSPKRKFYGCLLPANEIHSIGTRINVSVTDDPVIVTIDR